MKLSVLEELKPEILHDEDTNDVYLRTENSCGVEISWHQLQNGLNLIAMTDTDLCLNLETVYMGMEVN